MQGPGTWEGLAVVVTCERDYLLEGRKGERGCTVYIMLSASPGAEMLTQPSVIEYH